jgi:hypothetical protein
MIRIGELNWATMSRRSLLAGCSAGALGQVFGMSEGMYRNRRAVTIENEVLRLTVLREGGHIAEIFAKASGVNPLWTPPWPSIEPSTYDRLKNPEYGADAESKLLSGVMGHLVCLDIFGPPSAEEAAAGLTVHGEAPVAAYEISAGAADLVMRTRLPQSQLAFERRIRLAGAVVEFSESLENLTTTDRPIAWTQHVTLGPPFLKKGATQFRAPATRSKEVEGAEFAWPRRPRPDGSFDDMRTFTNERTSSGFTTHLMDPAREQSFFVAWSPQYKLAFGYVWRRADYPWLGIWEENYGRQTPPWNGKTLTRGMEFSASPIPEPRRKMVERGSLFGVPAFRWIPARTRVEVHYRAAIAVTEAIPETLVWKGDETRFV